MIEKESPNRLGIEALSVSIDRDPNFHAKVANDIRTNNPRLFSFLQTRVRQLFGTDTDAAQKSMALVAEIDWLNSQQQFRQSMDNLFGLSQEEDDQEPSSLT